MNRLLTSPTLLFLLSMLVTLCGCSTLDNALLRPRLVTNTVPAQIITLYVTNTESFNEVRFEGPGKFAGHTVQGHLAESRITVIANNTVAPRRLNKHINYSILAADPRFDTTAKNHSLATPTDIAVTADGNTLYVAHMAAPSGTTIFDISDPRKAKQIAKILRDHVGKEIGPIAKPKDIRFGDNLPKTRSGKIMRRLLRSLAKGEAITQDTSTLENPAILDQLTENN